MSVSKNILVYPEKYCRICFCDAPNQISLLKKIDEENNVCEVLSILVDSNISLEVRYPQQICSDCHLTLYKVIELKRRCILSEKLLKEGLIYFECENNSDNILYECSGSTDFKDLDVPNVLESKTECNEIPKTEIEYKKEPIKYELEYEQNDSSLSDGEYLSEKCPSGSENCHENDKHINNCNSDVAHEKSQAVIKITCPKCDLEFPSIQSLSLHVKQHIDKINKLQQPEKLKYQCSMCMRRFTKKTALLGHIKKHEQSSQIKFPCDTCKREFQHQAHLDNHILKVHTGDKGFNCNYCDKKFSTLKALDVHQEGHKIEKKYQCHMCNKSFIMLSSLNDHIRTHTGEKPHLCFTCGKGFSQKNNLDQHIRRHLGMKAFKCENCDKSFVSKGELVAHTRKHSGAHPFLCDDCGSGFTTSSSLVKHRRIHTGERPYSCDMCPMKFATSGTLKNHRRTHTGEKPFQCSYCEKAFVQRQDLVSHIRCHTGERPYVCTQCGQAFRKGSALKVHVKIHGKDALHLNQF